MGIVIDKLRQWNQQGLDLQRDVVVKVAELLSDIDEMPDGPAKDAAYAELNEYAANPIGYTISHGLEETGEALGEVLPDIANATLDVVRGLGGAIIEGLDGAYDAARGKLDGKEPDVVAGLVVVTLTILTAVYLFHSAKAAKDAF